MERSIYLWFVFCDPQIVKGDIWPCLISTSDTPYNRICQIAIPEGPHLQPSLFWAATNPYLKRDSSLIWLISHEYLPPIDHYLIIFGVMIKKKHTSPLEICRVSVLESHTKGPEACCLWQSLQNALPHRPSCPPSNDSTLGQMTEPARIAQHFNAFF